MESDVELVRADMVERIAPQAFTDVSKMADKDPRARSSVLRRKRFLVHFAVVAVIIMIGAGLIWLGVRTPITTFEAFEEEAAQFRLWVNITQILFVIGIAILLPRWTRYGPLYPLTLFIVSIAPVQALVIDGTQWLIQQVSPEDRAAIGVTFPELVFTAMGLFSIAFGIVAAAFGPPGTGLNCGPSTSKVRVASGLARPFIESSRRAEDELRRRIKAYFSKRPVWPWYGLAVGICLIIFAFTPNWGLQEKLFVSWTQFLTLSFGLSGTALLFGDQKRRPTFYANVFFVLLVVGSTLMDWATGYPYTAQSEMVQRVNQEGTQEALSALISYYFWYWLTVGGLTIVFSMGFRFFAYERWHLATDMEVDACIDADLGGLLTRAFARFGIDRSRLIAEPLCLRGFPDRSVLTNVFIGSWVDQQDRLRFTPQSALVVAFTADEVLSYEITVDLTTGIVVNETSTEFFYQDVSNVARVGTTKLVEFKLLLTIWGRLRTLFSRSDAAKRRSMKERVINDTLQFPGRDVFQINLDSGRGMAIVLRDDAFFDTKRKRIVSILATLGSPSPGVNSEREADLPDDENERAIRAIRSMIRDKKRGFLLEQH